MVVGSSAGVALWMNDPGRVVSSTRLPPGHPTWQYASDPCVHRSWHCRALGRLGGRRTRRLAVAGRSPHRARGEIGYLMGVVGGQMQGCDGRGNGWCSPNARDVSS